MNNARPIKRVRFQEAAHDNANGNTLQSPSNLKSNQTSAPSAEDICAWTHKVQATAPCLVRDIYSMRESVSTGPRSTFYWLGHIPCRIVLIVGVVVGIDVREKETLYTIDDSTGVIDCILRHLGPLAHLDSNARAAYWSSAQRHVPIPVRAPPLPATAIGYPVEVIGKVLEFHGQRRISAKSIKACESTNDQWKHVKTVVELHKCKYAVPKPFKIPAEVNPPSLIPSKRPLCEPSSPLTHSATSKSSSFLISGSIDPPQFRHPSQLHTADLTDNTFQLYLKHYLHHAPSDVPHFDTASPAFTLSHLRRIPELALLASRVVSAEMRRREPEQNAAHTRKRFNSRFGPNHPRVKMKRLFMWALLRLYEEGSIVLYDRLLIPLTVSTSAPPFDPAATNTTNSLILLNAQLSSALFTCPDANSSKCLISDDEAYLSDPPPLEEQEAYVPVTATLLAQPVRDIMSARGIRGKSTRVRVADIARDLIKLDNRWARVDLQAVDEAIDSIVID